jgi:hypothetical protein
MRHVRPDRSEVQVRKSGKSGKSYYAGLMACGSVWACPVCAPKIQSVRAAEVRQAIDEWTRRGGHVVMLTQTVPHTRQDALEPLLEHFIQALRKFKAGEPYKRLERRYGIAGSIRALEVTHGENGWHPHAHTILFLEPTADLDFLQQMEAALFVRWQSATARAGFGELSRDAFTLQDAAHVRNYVTKMGTEYQWNAEHELVKAHTKAGKGSKRSPFDLLRSYLADPKDRQALALFAEYAYVFGGRRQLVWSNGLKKRLVGSEGLTDEQIAESLGEQDDVLASIPEEDWKLIKQRNLQGRILLAADLAGRLGVEVELGYLRSPNSKVDANPWGFAAKSRPPQAPVGFSLDCSGLCIWSSTFLNP